MGRPNDYIIHAWADGSDIQYKQGDKWIDFDPTQLPWSMDRTYRIKPAQRWYRVAKMASMEPGREFDFAAASGETDEWDFVRSPNFIAWVTDRVFLEEND